MTNVPLEETFKINGQLVATLVVPPLRTTCPGVLLLHGFASCRDEVGGLFKALAAFLSCLLRVVSCPLAFARNCLREKSIHDPFLQHKETLCNAIYCIYLFVQRISEYR